MIEAAMLAEVMAFEYERRARDLAKQRGREAEEWENAHLLPLMSQAVRDAFLVERQRRKERREDIERQERHHRELVAAQRETASAVRRASSGVGSFARGFIWGSILG